MTQPDRVWFNARLATLDPALPGLGVVEPGMVAAKDGRIVYAGPLEERLLRQATERIDCNGRWITPGLIDCHTHLVYGGNRAREFEQRLDGVPYEAIARAGGGIAATVRATRNASEDQLVASALPRLDALLADGVTSIEIKSGYGLDRDSEFRLLRAARRLGQERRVTVRTTYLGAHATPPGCTNLDRYVDEIITDHLPALNGLADAVDGFCEGIAFSPAQIERIFTAAQGLGLPVKLHADQLSNLHGAALAARFQALSADHLECTDEAGIAAMAQAGTVAVLLPGAFYTLRETRLPPIAALRQAGVPMAISTDCNPGTSPMTSLLLAMNMAATLFRLTVTECLTGVTRHAAQALGLHHDTGSLTADKACDLAIWSVTDLAELVQALGARPLFARIWRGQ